MLHQDARVTDGQVVDGTGTLVAGASIAEDGTVYDAYMNPVSSVEAQSQGGSTIDPKVENPDIALPPAENSNDAEDTTVWDASTVEDKEQDGE